MRPIKVGPFSPITALTTAFATGVTSTGAALTLAATATTDGLAHLVTLTSAGGVDLSGVAFNLAGVDGNGNPVSETIAAGPNGTTVTSVKHYASGLTVTPAATMSTKVMSIGIGAESVSAIWPIDGRSIAPAAISVDISGTINYTLSGTFGNAFQYTEEQLVWVPITAFTTQTTDINGASTVGTQALQFKTNTVTNGGAYTVWISQPTQITG